MLDEIVDVVRIGRLTALQKPFGCVRGIITGDIMSHDIPTIATAQWSAPPLCSSVLSPTKFGAECIAHALQTLTDLDDRATVVN